MPAGGRPYKPKRISSSPRRSAPSDSRRRVAGREFKGSDSLHKSSGQILSEKRSMRKPAMHVSMSQLLSRKRRMKGL